MTTPSDDPLARFRTAASPERPTLLTPIAGGHVFRGTWEALADLDTTTCAACGEHIKDGGEAVEVVEHDGAGVAHRIMCDGWTADAAANVLPSLARGLTRQRAAPDDAGDLLPSRASHEAQVELYGAHWDASQPQADPRASLFRIGKAFEALSAALSDEEHALRMALEHDERSRVSDSAPPAEAPTELTAERLDDLDRLAREAHGRASKATAGPWGVDKDATYGCLVVWTSAGGTQATVAELSPARADDAAFAVAAREDVPVLSAAVLALSAEVRRLRRASTTIDGIECTLRIASLALSEPDPEDDCLRCHRTMRRADPSDERTPLCHYCAQAVLPTLAMLVQQLGGKDSEHP